MTADLSIYLPNNSISFETIGAVPHVWQTNPIVVSFRFEQSLKTTTASSGPIPDYH